MSKTLVLILNHNLPEYTNWLYYSLKKYQDSSFDIEIMDNGSREEFIPKHASIKIEKNVFWGGALNMAFEIVLSNNQYDSLLFLNNDIELNPKRFVQSMRNVMIFDGFTIVSPCIAGKPQPWRQMQNWCSKTPRVVKWIDNQAPLFHRKFIEAVRKFPTELYIGWGQDMICHDICMENNWKIGVCDHICIIHYEKQTLYKNRLYSLEPVEETDHNDQTNTISWDAYKSKAIAKRDAYFRSNPLKYESFDELLHYGLNYSFTKDEE